MENKKEYELRNELDNILKICGNTMREDIWSLINHIVEESHK